MDRISQLKILASAPTITNLDKAGYNKEFIELSDQLNSLKQQSFNKISLFSEIETGAGLFSSSTEALNISAQNGNSASISRHVIDFEDLRYITEAGDAAKEVLEELMLPISHQLSLKNKKNNHYWRKYWSRG